MDPVPSIIPISGGSPLETSITSTPSGLAPYNSSFTEMLNNGLKGVEAKIDNANLMVRNFSVDDNVPIHQVTVAMEEARLAVELALQVRARLVEGYREIMNMQL